MGAMDWIGLAPGKDMWRGIVNVIMNLRFPLNAGNLFSN